MISDEELKLRGLRALIAALGDVQAERFISLLLPTPFDYTKWQSKLWDEESVEDISREAMKLRSSNT